MRHLRPALLLAVCMPAFVAGDAIAMTPPTGRPSRIAVLEGSEALELIEVHTVLRCVELDDCEFETTHLVGSDVEGEATLVADGHRVAGLELTVGGVNALGTHVERENDNDRELPAVTRTTRRYLVVLPAGETTIVLRGTMSPRGTEDLGGVAVALPTRHPLLGTDPGWQRRNFLLDVSTAGTWGGSAEPTFALDMPAGADVRAPDQEPVEPTETPVISIWVAERSRGLVHGGPYVGVGGIVDDPGGWFGRVGYEFGIGLWTVLALSIDSDFSSGVVIAPTAHMASAAFSCIFPSFGLGFGPAIQLGSLTAVGGRGLVELQLPFVGLVGSLDWYPGLDAPNRVDFALLGRISF